MDSVLKGIIIAPLFFWLIMAANLQQDINFLEIHWRFSVRQRIKIKNWIKENKYYNKSKQLVLITIPVTYLAIPFHLGGYGMVRNIIAFVAVLIAVIAIIMRVRGYVDLLPPKKDDN